MFQTTKDRLRMAFWSRPWLHRACVFGVRPVAHGRSTSLRFIASSPCNKPQTVVTLRSMDVKDPHEAFDGLADRISKELGGPVHGWIVFAHGVRHLPGRKKALTAPLIGCTTEGFSYIHHSTQPFISVTGFSLPEGGRVETWASSTASIPPLNYPAALAAGSAGFLILAHPSIGSGALRGLHSRLSLLFPKGYVAAATAAAVRRGSFSIPAEVLQALPAREEASVAGHARGGGGDDAAVVGLVLHGSSDDVAQHILASAWADVEFDDVRGVLLSDGLAAKLVLPPPVAPSSSALRAALPAALPSKVVPPTPLFMIDTVLFPNQTAIL